MPIIQIKSIIFGVTQLSNTKGESVTMDIKGKYLIIMKISSVTDSFFGLTFKGGIGSGLEGFFIFFVFSYSFDEKVKALNARLFFQLKKCLHLLSS